MRRIFLIIGMLVALFFAIQWMRGRDGRHAVILAEATLSPSGGTVVLGDSIVEQSTISRDCGALNAGVGSATVAETLAFAPGVLAAAKPAKVLLAVGVNDAKAGMRTPLPEFRSKYDALTSLLGNRLVAIVAINPTEPGKKNSARIDLDRVAAENAIIAGVAEARMIPFIPPPRSVIGSTIDGVHPNVAGKAAWIARLGPICDPTH